MNKVFHIKDPFLKSIFLFIVILIFDFVTIVMDSGLPVALLYGSVLYYFHITLQGRNPNNGVFIGLVIPFISLSINYIILRAIGVSLEVMNAYYYPVFLTLLILSLSVIPILILIQKHKWEIPLASLRSILVQQLSVVSIAVALIVTLVLIDRFYDLNFDIHPRSMIMMLMALTLLILSRYLYQEKLWKEDSVELIFTIPDIPITSPKYSIPEELLEEYADRIKLCLAEKELYLNPGLSVEMLSQETEIPKHHFSELFNAYIGKSFYHLIAEYRIKKAMALIEERGHSMTIEALAYESGFNSKTSFNKHFKEINGFLPSEFRDRQLA